MFDFTKQLAQTTSDAITFITGLKYNTNLIKALNNLTFLYDPNWTYASDNPTYPLAFFHTVKMIEVMSSDISQKPMLFYNANTVNGQVNAGLLNIVSDNIIIKPKTYKIEVLVPLNMDTFFSGGYYNIQNVANVSNFIRTQGKETRVNDSTASVISFATTVISILKSLFTALYGTEISVSSIVSMLCRQTEYNKNAIEYMWRNRRILKLKLWNSWKFKYLAILDFEVTKTGTDGDYCEGTLICQEVPVLTFSQKGNPSEKNRLAKISEALGNAQKKAAETFIKAMETTAGGKK